MTMSPSPSAVTMRPGVMSMMRASPWVPVVITPACEPVNDRAVEPRSLMAIARRAALMRSPAVSSMSSSRGRGSGDTCSARSISSSVVSPIAEMTTTTSLPSAWVATIRRATRLMLSASATDEPPNFCTTRTVPLCQIGRPQRHHSHWVGRSGRTARPAHQLQQPGGARVGVLAGSITGDGAAPALRTPQHAEQQRCRHGIPKFLRGGEVAPRLDRRLNDDGKSGVGEGVVIDAELAAARVGEEAQGDQEVSRGVSRPGRPRGRRTPGRPGYRRRCWCAGRCATGCPEGRAQRGARRHRSLSEAQR